jgi:hypothetical protein
MRNPSDRRQQKILRWFLTALRRIGRYDPGTQGIRRENRADTRNPIWSLNWESSGPNKKEKSLLIAIDMDGTITKQAYPEIGEPLTGAFQVMKELQAAGHRLVLWSCREDVGSSPEHHNLKRAIEFCRQNGIEFESVNENILAGFAPLKGRKIYADVYIDDKNLGGFPGWEAVREMILGRSTRLISDSNGAAKEKDSEKN